MSAYDALFPHFRETVRGHGDIQSIQIQTKEDTQEYVSEKSGALACSGHKRTSSPPGKAAETLADTAWEEGVSLNVHHKDGGECGHEAAMRNEEIIIDGDTGDAETQTKEENLFLDPSVNNVM